MPCPARIERNISSRVVSRASPASTGRSSVRWIRSRCQRPRFALAGLRVSEVLKSNRGSVTSWKARLLAAIISRRCSAERYSNTAETVCATSSASATASSICPSRLRGSKRRITPSTAVRGDSADVGGQAVAAAPDGLDQLGIAAVLFHLAPEPADLVVDRAVEQVRLAALDHVEQPVAVEHLARVRQERDEQ